MSLFMACAVILCGVGFAEQPEHHGWIAGGIGALVLTIVSVTRRARLLKEAERARAIEDVDR